jgi:hypothetical protein
MVEATDVHPFTAPAPAWSAPDQLTRLFRRCAVIGLCAAGLAGSA